MNRSKMTSAPLVGRCSRIFLLHNTTKTALRRMLRLIQRAATTMLTTLATWECNHCSTPTRREVMSQIPTTTLLLHLSQCIPHHHNQDNNSSTSSSNKVVIEWWRRIMRPAANKSVERAPCFFSNAGTGMYAMIPPYISLLISPRI